MNVKEGWTKYVALLAGALVLTACGALPTPAPTATPTQDPEAPVFEIKLTEFSFNPDRIKLRVGQTVTFHVVNTGATAHELMIGRNPLRSNEGILGDGFEHDFFALTNPTVEGDATVMGMGEQGMEMDMGSSSSESDMQDMQMETPSAVAGMQMGEEGNEEGEMQSGGMVMFEPQQQATITFVVNENMLGTWTMGCFEVSQDQVHFDEGMAGIVYVLPQ